MDRTSTPSTERRAAVPTGGIVSAGAVLPAVRRERRESLADAVARRAVHANAVLWRDQNDRLAGQARSCGQFETGTATAAADGPGSHLREATAVGSRVRTQDLSVSAAQPEDRSARPRLGRRYHLHSP